MAAPTSPLATLEQCFTSLIAEPDPLAIDGNAVGHGLPPRPIPLNELRGLLHDLGPDAWFAAMNVLVCQVRAGSPTWLVGLAGVLLPGLRHLAAQQAGAGETMTAEARVLSWFRAALAAHDPTADQRIQWLLETTCTAQGRTRPAPPPRCVRADSIGCGVRS